MEGGNDVLRHLVPPHPHLLDCSSPPDGLAFAMGRSGIGSVFGPYELGRKFTLDVYILKPIHTTPAHSPWHEGIVAVKSSFLGSDDRFFIGCG